MAFLLSLPGRRPAAHGDALRFRESRSRVRPSEFPEDLVRFIRQALPSYRAAEVLIRVAREPARAWLPEDVVAEIPGLAAEGVRADLEHFAREGLVQAEAEDRFRYAPRSEELAASVARLVEAYDRRPVTLVRVMDSLATDRIRSFADAFRLKRD